MGNTSQVITQFIHDLVRFTSTENLQTDERFGTYLTELASLNDQIETLCTADENGVYPKTGKDGLAAVREKLMDVFLSTQQLQAAFSQQEHANDMDKVMDNFMSHILKDHRSLSGSLDGENKSLPELLSNSRGYRVDMSAKESPIYEEDPDQRISMTFTDSTGKKLTGHFMQTVANDDQEITEDTLSEELREKLSGVIREAIGEHEEYAPAILALVNNKTFVDSTTDRMHVGAYRRELVDMPDLSDYLYGRLKSAVREYLEEGEDADEYLGRVTKEKDFLDCVIKLTQTVAAVRIRHDMLESGKIRSFSNAEQRSAATTTMAGALGVPEIAAQTVKMRAIQDGVETEGLFTLDSEGTDFFNLKEGEQDLLPTDESLDNPEALKRIAQLQMLDYICGNTIRENSNTRFQFENRDGQLMLAGITGVENDCAFGSFGPENMPRLTEIVDSKNLLVVSEEMAARIMAMKKDTMETLLKEHGLSDEEVDYAWQRTEHIQKAITEGEKYFKENPGEKVKVGYLRVVKDDEWKDLHMKDLNFAIKQEDKINGRNLNYFTKYSDLPGFVKGLPEFKQRMQENDDYCQEKYPILKESKPEAVEGIRMDELNSAGIRHNQARIVELGKQMLRANEGFFIGSSEFKNLMNSFRDTTGRTMAAKEDMTLQEMTRLQESYRDLMEKTDVYLNKKEQEERALSGKGKTPSDTMQKRMAFARELREFVDERLSGMGIEMDAVDQKKLAVAKKLSEDVKQTKLSAAGNDREKQAIEKDYSGRGHESFEKGIMNSAVFQKFTAGKNRGQMADLASSSVNTIKDTIKRDVPAEKEGQDMQKELAKAQPGMN